MSPARGPEDETLGVQGISKAFEGTQAVIDVSFAVPAGQVVSLVGHNGSGKSTIVKIITGYHRPDHGRVLFGGKSLKPKDRPVAVMHQDLGLVYSLSVLDNLRVGRYRTGASGRIRWRVERKSVAERLEEFGCRFSPDDPVGDLTQGDRAMVALLRALDNLEVGDRSEASGVLVLDEPTASLASQEIDRVVDAIGEVRERGLAVLVVTHHLREVIEVADRILVMRNGALVMDRAVSGLTEDSIVEAMVGEARPVVGAATARGTGTVLATERREGTPRLKVEHLRGGPIADVSFEVWGGQVVGLAGLAGSGNSEIPYLVSGGRRRRGGTVEVRGRRLPAGKPASAKAKGVALVPSDRQRQGGVMSMSVSWNIALPRMEQLRRRGYVDASLERTLVERVMRLFHVHPPAPQLPLGALSGGNQQRALVGRWLDAKPSVLLLDDPCAGVDVMSREEILRALSQAAADGMAIVMASSQDDELAQVCTRVLIVSRGRIVKELRQGEISADQIGRDCLATSFAEWS